MKRFPNRKADDKTPFSTVNLCTQVASGDGRNGMDVKDIRERIKILDAVEVPGEYITMSDEVHRKLCDLINAFQFAQASRGLLTILDDILNAETFSDGVQQTGG